MESKGILSVIAVILGIVFSPITSFAELDSDKTVIIPGGTSIPGCEETNECYLPYAISSGVGDTITWFIEDSAAHTVTSGKSPYKGGNGPDGLFDSSLFMPGNTFSFTFEDEGIFDYFCIVHPWMTGVILVDENYGSPTNDVAIIPDINLLIDKSIYLKGDTIHVSGTVSEFFENLPVGLAVTRPDEKIIHVEQISVHNNKTFETELVLDGPLYDVDGFYFIHVQYGSSEHSVDLVTFEFRHSIVDSVPPLLLVPSDMIVDTRDTQGARVDYTAKAIDDVDGVLESFCNPSPNYIFPIGDSLVTCNAFDSAGNQITKSFTITVQLETSEFVIPEWIKNVAQFWCNGQIDDGSFIEAIDYLIENKVILVPTVTESEKSDSTSSPQVVPQWIKNNACWWGQNLISDGDFALGIEYLIKNDIIRM